MKLEHYIGELLYHYDCVVVPEFGGFLSHWMGSSFNALKYEFKPPRKRISFNINLSKNDGLLANHISNVEKISYQEATIFIERCVAEWSYQLEENGETELAGLGRIVGHQSSKLEFIPDESTNFLQDSFGLEPVIAHYHEQTPKKTLIGSSKVFKYAAAVASPIAVGFLTYLFLFKSPGLPENSFFSGVFGDLQKVYNQEQLDEKTRTESIDLFNAEDKTQPQYDLIVGAFKKEEEALRFKDKLTSKGHTAAQIINSEGSAYSFVSLSQHASEEEALNYAEKVEQDFPEAWPRKR